MKRTLSLLVGLAMLGSLASVAFADLTAYKQIHVYTNVSPNMFLGGEDEAIGDDGLPIPDQTDPVVALPDVQTGTVTGVIRFRIDANQQKVGLFATVTPLFKGDNPASAYKIPVYTAAGVKIAPEKASPLQGGSNVATLPSASNTVIDGFPAYQSSQINFESSQNNDFSQFIDVTFVWKQPNNELPTGEYSGKVRLTAVAIPQTVPSAP